MSVLTTSLYTGNKRVKTTHEPSGSEITTVAPKDNGGDGSLFSPTDLVGASMGACMLTIMGLVAERDGLAIEGTRISVEKHMGTNPRRISELTVVIELPQKLTEDERAKMERAALTCPVHKSLHPDIKIPIEFRYVR